MKLNSPHSWVKTVTEARIIQEQLRTKVITKEGSWKPLIDKG